MSNDSQGSPSSRPRLYPSQMQIERLKREDEEEHWISGEELYTEGSSDDEEDLQRLIIGDSEIRGNTGNSRSNLIGSNTAPVAVGRLKMNHPRSAQPGNRSFLSLRQKGDIGETNFSGNSITSIPIAATIVEKLTLSSKEIETEITNVASGSVAEKGAGENITEEVDREEEISWRPKRDDDYNVSMNLISEESIVQLRELQFEYHDILDIISSLKASLCKTSSLTNRSHDRQDTIKDYNCGIIENGNIAEFILEEEETSRANCEEESLPTDTRSRIIEDVSFSDQDVDRWSNAVVNMAKIKKEISKIVKLDTCIEQLDQKVEQEIKDTLEEQISNRKELRRLQILRGAPESQKLAKNSQLFYKLCSMDIEPEDQDIESVCTVLPIYQSQDELELEDHQVLNFEFEFDEKESRKLRKEKLEERLKIINKRRASFIERNMKLASCAVGTLSITDEEKKRLEELVKDIDDEELAEFNIEEINDTDDFSILAPSTPYTIDKEADELLEKLTEQLKDINSETYRKYEEENRLSTRDELIQQKEQLVINSLRGLAESGSKEIHPISEEVIKQLINEYYAEEEARSSRSYSKDISNISKFETKEESKPETSISMNSQNPVISNNIIDELVKEAKTAMPFFQFKHQAESTDEFEDKNEG